jgi:hypothetical protein
MLTRRSILAALLAIPSFLLGPFRAKPKPKAKPEEVTFVVDTPVYPDNRKVIAVTATLPKPKHAPRPHR